MFAPYARTEVVSISAAGLVLTAATAYWFGWWALLPAALAAGLLSFYRDPSRRVPDRPFHLVSPADGRIALIEREHTLPELEGRWLRIVIFLSVANVHLNRSPTAGRVADLIYQPGEFRNALNPASTDRNENNVIVIEPDEALPGPVRVRQIAGVLARRIVCPLVTGQQLSRGERVGMIKLGSRTELCVPEHPDWEIHVSLGSAVRGASTILLSLPQADTRDSTPREVS